MDPEQSSVDVLVECKTGKCGVLEFKEQMHRLLREEGLGVNDGREPFF